MNCIGRVLFSFFCFIPVRSSRGFVALTGTRHPILLKDCQAPGPVVRVLESPVPVSSSNLAGLSVAPSLKLSSGDSAISAGSKFKRPDPSTLLSAKGRGAQRRGFASIVGVLGLGTFLFVRALALLRNGLPSGWFDAFKYFTGTLTMGSLYAFIGITHFAVPDTYTAFVPPKGTWGGLWQLPAPGAKLLGFTDEEYHTYWTGLVEIVGGALLVLSGFPFNVSAVSTKIPALVLFLLTCAVTPANIYMFTHDIRPPRLAEPRYPEAHYFRGVMQCLFLSTFWILAFP